MKSGPIKTPTRKHARRPLSIDNKSRVHRHRDTVHVDESKAVRRRKIITEFYETERAYVEGLDLIYTVRICYTFRSTPS